MIEREHLDLVFFDVQMPELNGLAVLEAVDPVQMPLTVFVTAYDEHAIRAFETNALDYLLKPFSDERLEATVNRARARLRERKAGQLGQTLLQMMSGLTPGDGYLERLIIKSADAIHFVRATDIDWIEGAGVYVNLHVSGRELLYRASLHHLTARLDPNRFVRVHRSATVNIESIVRLEPASHGEFDLVLKDGRQTRVSRTYRAHSNERWVSHYRAQCLAAGLAALPVIAPRLMRLRWAAACLAFRVGHQVTRAALGTMIVASRRQRNWPRAYAHY